MSSKLNTKKIFDLQTLSKLLSKNNFNQQTNLFHRDRSDEQSRHAFQAHRAVIPAGWQKTLATNSFSIPAFSIFRKLKKVC
jgi:hypothetical protein